MPEQPSFFSLGRRVLNSVKRKREPAVERSEPGHTSEHLLRGNKPIMVCIHRAQRNELPEEIAGRIALALAKGRKVQYEDSDIEFARSMAVSGEFAFVAPNGSDKVSTEFRNCVGIVVVGKTKTNEKQISFVFHVTPDQFVFGTPAERAQVRAALRERLDYMKRRCKHGSIDAVIVGGNDPSRHAVLMGSMNDDYRTMVEAYSETVREALDFDPVVAAPALVGAGNTHLYFETGTRRLFLFTDEDLPENVRAFRARQVGPEQDAWRRQRDAT